MSPTETTTLDESSAIAASRNAGVVLAEIFPDRPPQQIAGGSFEECCLMGRQCAAMNSGRVFGVFKLARDFKAEGR